MRLVHELQVHQIELEMQNEELRQAQIDLELSAERYADLYDFAPVGYLSVAIDGKIIRANLTAAAMVGWERRELVGNPFHRFIAVEHLDRFHTLRRRLIVPEIAEGADLLLQPAEGQPFWARLEIITRRDPTSNALLWQVAISNIDAQKRAEILLHGINEELEEQVERRTHQLTLSNRQLLEEISLRKSAEAELRQREELLEQRVAERTAELAALLAVARDITSTLEIDRILAIILAELRRIIPYDGCAIFLVHGKILTLVAYNGPLPREKLLQSQTTLEESPLLAAVIERRGAVLIADMLEDRPLAVRWHEHAGALQRLLLGQSRAWLGIPMIAQGQPVGVLRLDHGRPGYFTPHHANLALTLASQAAIAVVNARLYQQAQQVAVVEERQRLARELHDSVAQTFYSIALATHSAKMHLHNDPKAAELRLGHVLELAEVGLTEMKALIFDLHVEGLRREGLVQAIRRYLDALGARNDIRIHANLGPEPNVALTTKEALYGIAREALQNVVRHANATDVWIEIGQSDESLSLEVRDNGRGFTPDQVGQQTLGLRSMQERVAATGGGVEIISNPGQGAVVRAHIPLPMNQD